MELAISLAPSSHLAKKKDERYFDMERMTSNEYTLDAMEYCLKRRCLELAQWCDSRQWERF